MLGAAEALLELRFVEKIDDRVVVTTINKFPAIIGRGGTVVPALLTNQVSMEHCTINWNWVHQQYQVQDGVDGKPSTNHIYSSKDGGELVICDKAILKTLKDRVYLLSTIDGQEGYLELFDPNKQEIGNERSTLSLDPEMVKLKELVTKTDELAIEGLGVAIETKAIAQKNSAAIGEIEVLLDPKVRQAIAILQTFGTHPRVFLLGAAVVFVTGVVGLTLLFVHANMTNIYEDIRSRNQHNERAKEPDRTTPRSN